MLDRIRTRWLLVGLLAASGCGQRPKAPPLAAEAMFRDEKLGLRFLAPAEWNIASRSDIPPGTLSKPVVIVQYISSGNEKPAEFEVVIMDLPEDADLSQYLLQHPLGPVKWSLKGAVDPSDVGGLAARRFRFSSGTGRNESQREVVAVRRGGRVFFFVITFAAQDEEHLGEARRSIASVAWTN